MSQHLSAKMCTQVSHWTQGMVRQVMSLVFIAKALDS